MIDKTQEIKAFLKKHFTPGLLSDTREELQLTTSEVLSLLFTIFPSGSIDDYDLHNLLVLLGYEPQRKTVKRFVWCLKEVDPAQQFLVLV